MNSLRKFAAVSVLIGAGIPLAAQTVPQDQVPEEEIVVLSPFEVTGTRDTGYQATETLAGTRIRTNLRDVASAISVITEEFLQDVGATDSATLLQYTPNAEVAGTRGTYAGLGNATSVDEGPTLVAPASAQRVRGLAAADNTRDFFGTDIPWDSSNVDRIDINRGANSFLFGLGSPAGIVNAAIKSAEFMDRGSVEARFGSYGSWRASLDLNEQLIDNKLALRLTALYDHEKFQQDPAFEDDERIGGALRWDPQLFSDRTWRTSIRVKAEHGKIEANRPRIIPPNDSVTPWFRPVAVTADNPFGGMNKLAIENGYFHNGAAVGTGYQTAINPWIGSVVNQQQPMWFMDGSSGDLFRALGGYINNGARNSTGGFTGIAGGIVGKRYAEQMFNVRPLNQAATTMGLPGASFGQFRTQSLMDPTVFDFYNNLIDGPNKAEWENWDAFNIDITQTAFDDRFAVQFVYDKQDYDRGGESLLGYSPTLTVDITRNLQDFYVTNPTADGTTSTTNPNFGRPFTTSSGGSGSSYESEREHMRASLFAELRASDLFDKDSFLEKLLGKHRFSGVYSTEDYSTENRGWVQYANPQEWAGFWNGNTGSGSPITDRPPTGVFYLGPSIAGLSSASGANIPGITSSLVLPDTGVRIMDSTWTGTVPFGDPWTTRDPASLDLIYPLASPPTGGWTQASNPANYLGWIDRPISLLRNERGQNPGLLTRAQLSNRKTKSLAGSVQSFLWNEAIVATLGWRYDEVKSKAINAAQDGGNRSILKLGASDYSLPSDPQAVFKDHSTSGGVVVHLNRLFPKDPLPLNVSFSYNKSNNFQITDARRDIYGTVIPNPTGATKDYGVLLSTKDGRYSLRAIKYETSFNGGSSGIGDPGGIGAVIRQGLRFRNVFLYDLGGYDWGTRDQPQGRNTWGGSIDQGDPNNGAEQLITAAQGRALEDAAIRVWNQIQADMAARGFFDAWGFTPQDVPLTLDRSAYEANPAGNAPSNTAQVYAYGSSPPPGFTVTADTLSKGYEFELTANPTPNWRIAFNASKTQAVRNNVGGPVLDEYIAYIDEKLATPIGTFTDLNGATRSFTVGDMPQFGNSSLSIYANVYGPWRSNYVLMKLQEGAAAPEIREWRYNFITNYSFTEGRLKGFGVGGSYRWQDEVVIGYPVVAGGSFDLSKPYHGPSEDAVDLWASYEKKLTKKVDWRIQLNIRNAFADEELIPISVQPDGTTWGSVRMAPVQEWFVTNTFSF